MIRRILRNHPGPSAAVIGVIVYAIIMYTIFYGLAYS